jgi:hypothetical protein
MQRPQPFKKQPQQQQPARAWPSRVNNLNEFDVTNYAQYAYSEVRCTSIAFGNKSQSQRCYQACDECNRKGAKMEKKVGSGSMRLLSRFSNGCRLHGKT